MALTRAKLEELIASDEIDLGGGGLSNPMPDTTLIENLNADLLDGKHLSELLLLMYPVGSIYQSAVSTPPNTLFGGTWESLGGRVLIGVDGTHAAGSTGGNDKSTFTLNNDAYAKIMTGGAASVGVVAQYISVPSWGYNRVASGTESSASGSFAYGVPVVGTTVEKSIMNPYLAVYMWKRTA